MPTTSFGRCWATKDKVKNKKNKGRDFFMTNYFRQLVDCCFLFFKHIEK
jgi:hypothetical protein